jgi:hypothetical protein
MRALLVPILSLLAPSALADGAPKTVAVAPVKGKPLQLPARLVEGRFFAEPVTTDGKKLTLYTDTGGGLFISAKTVARYKLPVSKVAGDDGKEMEAAALPAFKADATIPGLPAFGGLLPVLKQENLPQPVDALLGQAWFKDRVWTFDYPSGHLLLRAPGDVPAHDAGHEVALGFLKDASGHREANYPRIAAKVDGERIDLLFDTGATVVLSERALAALNDGHDAVRATSFITKSIFERWRKRNPNWRVIEGADNYAGGAAMIEVPTIEVAGYQVGPVWFTVRADANFRDWMSQWMDKKIDGALGGSALQYFRVTVNYPRAIAIFEPAQTARRSLP